MSNLHQYEVSVTWTGNKGKGTHAFNGYDRSHEIEANGKAVIEGSSDPSYRGQTDRWNPAELLVAALSTCHKLWYLNLCATNGIIVTSYKDNATGVMRETDDGGYFDRVVLKPVVTIAPGSDISLAKSLHAAASQRCFIKSSVNFPVEYDAAVRISVIGG